MSHGGILVLCNSFLETSRGLFVMESVRPYQTTVEPGLCFVACSSDFELKRTKVVRIILVHPVRHVQARRMSTCGVIKVESSERRKLGKRCPSTGPRDVACWHSQR